jgi:acetylornithine/succinyldiaminopimelate/putrescine aminotransferase
VSGPSTGRGRFNETLPGPKEAYVVSTKKTSQQFTDHIFHTVNRDPLWFTGGKGATLTGCDRKTYVDFFSGLAVNNLGYGHAALGKAAAAALKKPWHSSNVFLIPTQAELAALIQKRSFPGRSFFANSGAEANETAYKFAIKRGRMIRGDKTELIAAKDSFHGRTMGALSLTGQPKYQDPFAPFPGNARFVAFNHLAELEAAVNEKTAAVFLEPIQGESGVHVATPAYLAKARELCDKFQALLIYDEVQCGCARTGKLFGWEHAGVAPDGFTLAKGLASGMPIGCFTAAEAYKDVFAAGDHNSTFGGGPFVTSVALEAFKIYSKPAFLKQVVARGQDLRHGLETLRARFSAMREVRGKGLMLAMDFVPGSVSTDKVRLACRAKGLLVNSIHNHILRIIPPLVITQAEIDKGLAILEQAIRDSI